MNAEASLEQRLWRNDDAYENSNKLWRFWINGIERVKRKENDCDERKRKQ